MQASPPGRLALLPPMLLLLLLPGQEPGMLLLPPAWPSLPCLQPPWLRPPQSPGGHGRRCVGCRGRRQARGWLAAWACGGEPQVKQTACAEQH
jgi:hypothetical protein